MNRAEFLAERRAVVERTYDAEAPTYDCDGEPITATHRAFVERLLETCPAGGTVLDAPCGTGRYFEIVVNSGRHVVGADQSAGMLAQARSNALAASLVNVGLQEMPFKAEFDGSMTVDSLENVPPEEWPRVLANLHRAVRHGGHLYFTVEEIDAAEIDDALAASMSRGLPVVHGELVEGDVAGYHYYPGRERVLGWLSGEGLTVVEEGFNQADGYGYRHFLVR